MLTEEYYEGIMREVSNTYSTKGMDGFIWGVKGLKDYYNAKQGLNFLRAQKATNPSDRKKYEWVSKEAFRFSIYELPDILKAHSDECFSRLREQRSTS